MVQTFMLAAFQKVLLSLKCFNNSQQFPIVSFIPSLSKNYLSRKKNYQMSSAQIIRGQLTKNSTNSIAKCIRFNLDMTFWIKWFTIGALTNACLNSVKVFLALKVKNNPNQLANFLALEASTFLTQIHFLDLAVF